MAETRRNEQHDPSGSPQGQYPVPGASSEAFGGPSGNRPATGAREATAPPASSGWQAGAGATDFLGLEPELRTGVAEQNGANGPTESWLFDIEQAASMPEPSAGPAHPMSGAPGSYSEPADPAGELDEAGDAELAPDLEDVPPEPTVRRSRRVLAGLAVLGVVAVAGWFGWQRYGARLMHSAPDATAVATANPNPKPSKPAPARPAVEPATDGSATAVAAPTPPTAGETPANSDAIVVAPAAVETAGAPEVQTPVAPEPELVARADTAPTGSAPAVPVATVAPNDAALVRSTSLPAKAPELPTGNPGPGGGRHATDRDWAGMWLEPTIPSDAIRGPTRLRTLNVGLVRAELVNGEFVEGRLHAVGESRIWLDVKLGRMSFDAGDVRDLVQIVGGQGQPLPIGSQALAGLQRVEVLLPGGSLMGHVLGREGDRVTFVTEEGMRLRVEALDVRPAPNGRSRLVGPAVARKP